MATGAPTSGYGPPKEERSEIEPVGKRKWRGRGRMVGERSPAREVRARGGGGGRDSYEGEARNLICLGFST